MFNAPTNAALNPSTGLFTWRPTVAQANSSNRFSVVVTDNGSPSLSATQAFTVLVSPLAAPSLTTSSLANGQFTLQIAGTYGPDYTLQASTNLVNWTTLFTTNQPSLPLNWTDPQAGAFPHRFYRVLLGP